VAAILQRIGHKHQANGKKTKEGKCIHVVYLSQNFGQLLAMFKKILIANRGEIACRIIKTARNMGIATVAVFSDADARALHVELADEAVNIGPAAASQSYLVIEKIIAVCKSTGAEAVHPGYGFLSERAAFATACAEAGIVFIGPNPHAINAMGDKIASKLAAVAAGVSVVPGHVGVIADVEEALRISDGIGYPVMIKASAGGGGKGMRIAYSQSEVREGFERATSEAKNSFGDERVFIEKFITNPRHIEIQVLGDKHGNVIHLGERECSIQRRNQKVIEEAPSPLLDEATRQAMGAQAVALAKAVNYDSAGTVEFVAGQDRSFYFLEMNTRLQVEHPVTELVTGIDLVEQMIRVAYGEKLALQQSDVKVNGWAIESRIYAEDPYRNFLPSIGRLVKYRPPTEQYSDGITIRNDTGVYEGGEISIHYDPMIAKLCSHAASRMQAVSAMSQALDEFHIEGIKHNIPFLSAIMNHPRWQSGHISTGFIAEEFEGGFKGVAIANTALFVRAACLLDHIENSRKRQISGQMTGRDVKFALEREVKLGEDWHKISVSQDLSDEAATCGWQPGGALLRVQCATMQVQKLANGYRLAYRGSSVDAYVYTQHEAGLVRLMPVKKLADTSKKLLCPMPGTVISISAVEGQEVKAGDTIAIVEAMKMENVLRAERDCTVKKVHVKQGDSLAVDAVMVEFS
jgi:propionyl-CoA carboxylase alpha chain